VRDPEPFPVELPQRLVELYAFEEDVVLDPFLDARSTGHQATGARRSKWTV